MVHCLCLSYAICGTFHSQAAALIGLLFLEGGVEGAVERRDHAAAAQWLQRAAGIGMVSGSGSGARNGSASGTTSGSASTSPSAIGISNSSSVLAALRGGCAVGMHYFALCSLLPHSNTSGSCGQMRTIMASTIVGCFNHCAFSTILLAIYQHDAFTMYHEQL